MEILLNQPCSFIQLGRRTNQEDARFPDEDMPQDYNAAFVICDGVGGQDCGEVASRIVADSIGKSMQKYDLSKPFGYQDFEKVLKTAYKAIGSTKKGKPEMATTMAFICFHSEGVFIAHIGDSRIYHIRPQVGIMHQSNDHSLVYALVHSGNLTPEEAIGHPQSNIITRCISPSRNAEYSTATTLQISDVEAGDYFFLCTDGVLHQLDDSDLLYILSSDKSDAAKIDEIAQLSKNSSDNNTAYLIGISDIIYDVNEEVNSNEDTEAYISDTTPLSNTVNEIIETRKITNNSLGTQISDFFNKLF